MQVQEGKLDESFDQQEHDHVRKVSLRHLHLRKKQSGRPQDKLEPQEAKEEEKNLVPPDMLKKQKYTASKHSDQRQEGSAFYRQEEELPDSEDVASDEKAKEIAELEERLRRLRAQPSKTTAADKAKAAGRPRQSSKNPRKESLSSRGKKQPAEYSSSSSPGSAE